MNSRILEIENIQVAFNGIRALNDFSCYVNQSEILGLIGPNGAGKTTLFNVISGFISSEYGGINLRNKNITKTPAYKRPGLGIARTFQELRLIRQISVKDNVLLSVQNQPGERIRDIFFHWQKCKQINELNKKEADKLIEEVGLAKKKNDYAKDLSYGQQKLLSIACCLAVGADIILLDEPVAGIAPEMINRILDLIKSLPEKGKSVVLIEHNLDAVREVCDRVIFMDAGKKICEGKPDEVRNDPRVIEAYVN